MKSFDETPCSLSDGTMRKKSRFWRPVSGTVGLRMRRSWPVFTAILLSGGELAESVCGVPDIGLITADDLVQSAARISQYSVLPVIVDADDGFGDTPTGGLSPDQAPD